MTTSRPLTALAEAQAALLALLSPTPAHDLPCVQAVGAVAAQASVVTQAAPERAVALRAGYAVASQDLAGASSFSPASLPTRPRLVDIGDALPDGCDCVLDAAAVDLAGPMALAFADAYPGENARRPGEDFATGATIVRAGRRIAARDALAAECAGLMHLSVRQPRVLIAGASAAAHYVAHFARRDGAAIDGSARPDLIVCVGETPEAAAWFARGLALEPGRDCGVGRLDATPFIYLPAAAEQAFAGCYALLRPALDRLTGRVRSSPRAAPLSAKIASRVGVAELALLREADGVFTPLAVGDLPLHVLGAATHVALIAAQSEGHVSGETIAADPLDE